MFHINPKFQNSTEYVICNNKETSINLGIVENFNQHKSYSVPKNINFYPSIIPEYYQLLNEIKLYIGCNVKNILIMNGSGKGLDLILHAFTIPMTKILIPIPNYPGFIHNAEISNGEIIYINDFYGLESDYICLEEKLPESNIIYFSTPNLPVGYTLDRHKILNYVCNNSDKLFIIDEAYFEYCNEKSFALLVNEYKNIIITRTFSKAFALAGARIGYIIAHPDIINILRVGYNSKDVTNSSICYALDVMKNKQYYLDNVARDLKLSEYIDMKLSEIISNDKQIYNFTTINAPWFLIYAKDTKYVCDTMDKNGYIVRDKSCDIEDCIRISLCTKNHIDSVIEIIKDINRDPTTKKPTNIHYDTIFLDLDITLRENYNSNIPIEIQQKITSLQKKSVVKIITDNYKNNEDINDYLLKNNIICDVISPIHSKMNPYNKKWFIYDNAVYIAQFPDYMINLFISINKYKIVRVIETDDAINISELGDFPDIKIPHIGTILNFINNCSDVKIEIIGKQTMLLENYKDKSVLMIGDSKNDEIFAKLNKFTFKKIASNNDTLIHLINLL